MLDLAILGLLDEQELHGYELKKRLSGLTGARSVSFGSLYPALARLERSGAVMALDPTTGGDARATVPPTGSLAGEAAAFLARRRTGRTGRNRKAYAITDAGRAQLVELIRADDGDDRTFTLKVAFCRALPPADRLAVFGRQRELVARRLRERGERGEAADLYRRLLRERDTASLRAELAWLDRLVDAERAAQSPEIPIDPPAPVPAATTDVAAPAEPTMEAVHP